MHQSLRRAPRHSNSLSACDILALCAMTEHMTGAPAVLLGVSSDCSALTALSVAASRGAVTSAARIAPSRVDAEYLRVFGAALAAAHGARLRQAALDTAALVALLELAPHDRAAMFG